MIAALCAWMLLSACRGGGEEIPLTDLSKLPDGQNLAHDYLDVTGIKAQPGMRIAVVVMDQSDAYWQAVEEGAERAVELINKQNELSGDDEVVVTFDGAGSNDIDAQINAIDAIVAENPSAICIAAIDMVSCEPQLKVAQDSGIPVVMMDSGVESDLVTSLCGTDNAAAGRLAAEELAKAIGGQGEVAIVTHDLGMQTGKERLEGIEDAFAAQQGVRVTAHIEQDAERPTEEQIEALLESDPQINGIVCTSEGTSEAALAALEKAGREDIALVGFDSGKEQLSAVRDGREAGLVSQDPRAIGFASVTAAVRASLGDAVDRRIRTGYIWIDQNNVNSLEVLPYLYEEAPRAFKGIQSL